MARDYKQEWATEKARQKKKGGVLEAKLERQRARRKLDKDGVDRKGKDIAHRKALSKGGSNKTGYFLESPSANRSFKRNSDGSMKGTYDSPKKK